MFFLSNDVTAGLGVAEGSGKKKPTRVFFERPDKILWRLRSCLLIVSIVCQIFRRVAKNYTKRAFLNTSKVDRVWLVRASYNNIQEFERFTIPALLVKHRI